MIPKVLLCLTDGVEDIEAVTIIDLLTRAKIKILTINITQANTLTLTCAYGTKIVADFVLTNSIIAQTFDAIILPGGLKASQTYRDTPIIIKKIKDMQKNDKIVGAICATPAIVLEYHNLFPYSKMTCYPKLQHKISKEKFVNLPVYYDINTKLLTSQSPATSFNFALKLIEILCNQNIAQEIASQLFLSKHIYNYKD